MNATSTTNEGYSALADKLVRLDNGITIKKNNIRIAMEMFLKTENESLLDFVISTKEAVNENMKDLMEAETLIMKHHKTHLTSGKFPVNIHGLPRL